ncbi:hypothetical protein [Nitrosomonas communis]|uniref:Uncharacterized protein n=1 Tax=Nitrosomonas communis TaxID=44574 RepID=A0A1I4RNJ0_9PROT|nr:hypothetical protein [Nitrosomonas communis]SFM53798.1 hypothetical protein SAMN05421863_103415 [Nitrosomonas communis]
MYEISILLNEKQCLIGNAYAMCSEKDSAPYHAIETLLKGPEVALPEGVTFKDKDGHTRKVTRIKWWIPAHYEIKERLHLGSELTSDHKLADMPLDSGYLYPLAYKPAFIGHYWMNDKIPKSLSHNCACLDYSIAEGGKLVAYKWRGEKQLKESHFERCK